MRLIDADALKRMLCKTKCGASEKLCVGKPDSCFQQYRMDMLTLTIDEAPTIETEPVMHGRWEFAGDYDAVCTNCCIEELIDWENPYDYCPNCGAKMDLEVKYGT